MIGRRALRAWSLAAVACAGHATTVTKPVNPAGPPYDVLFQLDRAWSMPFELTVGHKQGASFAADRTVHGTVNCKVGSLRKLGDASVAHVSCDPPLGDLLVSGDWVSTAAGLYHPATPVQEQQDVTSLGNDDLLIEATPQERHHEHAVEETRDASDAFTFNSGWCVRGSRSLELDRRDYTLCFQDGDLTGGSDLVIVGPSQAWRRIRFGQVAPDPDDPTVGGTVGGTSE